MVQSSSELARVEAEASLPSPKVMGETTDLGQNVMENLGDLIELKWASKQQPMGDWTWFKQQEMGI